VKLDQIDGRGVGAGEGRAPKVFCSYGAPDREAVEELAAWLREHGVDAWLDLWEISPGDVIVAKIEQGLAEAELVLVFLSRQGVGQPWHRAEVEASIVRMLERGIRVVPVKLEADAPVPPLLSSISARRIEEREAILESIHGRSRKPVLGPPPELWSAAARRVVEERFTAARERGGFGVDEAAAVEEALQRIVGERVRWVERPGVCLASIGASVDEIVDLRLPLELLPARATASPVVLRCELRGTESKREEPSPRPEGGRIVLAMARVPDEDVFEAVQHACWAGLHHVGLAKGERQRSDLDRRGAFDPARDRLRSVTRTRLVEGLGAGKGWPGAAMLLLACRVHKAGLCLCDAAGAPMEMLAEDLGAMLEPLAGHLRVVVLLPIAGEGPERDLGAAIVDAALALHRRGIAAVVAPRVPLLAEALPDVASELLGALLGDPRTLPLSLEVALARVCSRLRAHAGLARLGLRLYARAADGDDTRPLVIRPYRGLVSFEPEQQRFYLGRRKEIEKVVARLAELERRGEARLVILVGASGAGKSSLAKAGVVPALVGGGGSEWVPVITRPADEGLEQLDARLREVEGRRLVVVDQLEEVFDESEREAAAVYLRRLWSLAKDEHGTAVVATLRIDALDVIGEVMVDQVGGFTLERLVSGRHALYVCHLGADELREVIAVPASHVGLEFDEGLVDRLCEEALAEPGALPMLEVALEHLWRARRGRRMPASAFEHGLAGTLTRQANACVEELPRDQQEHARRILIRIATGRDVGISTWRRRSTVQALRPERPERRAAFEGALEALVESRLVVLGQTQIDKSTWAEGEPVEADVSIELAHELLLRRWDALRSWIEQDRPRLQAIRDLERWVDEWKQRGTRLTAEQLAYIAQARLVEGNDDLNAEMRRLLEESRRAVMRSKRARRAALAGVGAVALALAVLGYVAVTQRNEAQGQTERANEQKRLADERLDLGVALTRVLIEEVVPKLEHYPRTRMLKREILEKLLAMQIELEATDADVEAQRYELAAHLLRGDEAQHTDNVVVARDEYRAALRIASTLVEGGSYGGAKRDLTVTLSKLGYLQSQAGDLTGARELLRRSLDVAEELAQASPDDRRAKQDLRLSLTWLGAVERQDGKLSDARPLVQRALAISEDLANATPDSMQAKNDLSSSLVKLGELELQAGNLSVARSLGQRALAISAALERVDQNSPMVLLGLWNCSWFLGEVELRAAGPSGARSHWQSALALADRMAEADPDSAKAKRNLALSFAKLAEVELESGNVAGARDLYQSSSEVFEQLMKADQESANAKRDLSISLIMLGRTERRAGRLDRARGIYQRVLQQREELVKADSSDTTAKRDLMVAIGNLGWIEFDAGNLERARELFEQAVAMTEALAQVDPDDAGAKRDRAVTMEALGEVERKAGNVGRARDLFEGSLAMAEELMKDQNDVSAKQDLAEALSDLGEVEESSGNIEVARDLFRRELAIAEELANVDSDDPSAGFDVVHSHMRLVALAEQVRDTDAIREHLTAAKMRLDALEAKGQIAGNQERELMRETVRDKLEHLAKQR
jgi:tetratricopeptide (TPR) repeat protein